MIMKTTMRIFDFFWSLRMKLGNNKYQENNPKSVTGSVLTAAV